MNEDGNGWKEEEKKKCQKFFMPAGVKEGHSKFLCVPVPD